jgi:hypothetical protein
MPEQPQQCQAQTRDGRPCRARARPGGTVCIFHDPQASRQRAEARRRGGRHAHRNVAAVPRSVPDFPLRTPAEVRAALAVFANLTVRGQLDSKLGNAATYMLSVMLRSLSTDDLVRRVEALEANLRNTNGKAAACTA